jgi:hypothetical protein
VTIITRSHKRKCTVLPDIVCSDLTLNLKMRGFVCHISRSSNYIIPVAARSLFNLFMSHYGPLIKSFEVPSEMLVR